MLSFGYVAFFCINDIPGLMEGNVVPFGSKSKMQVGIERLKKNLQQFFKPKC